MAENEAKARKKLEDAEKKAKGGSGFFSGLFGNAKAEEAADLFVQVSFFLRHPNFGQNDFFLQGSSVFGIELVFSFVICKILHSPQNGNFWIINSAYSFSIPPSDIRVGQFYDDFQFIVRLDLIL